MKTPKKINNQIPILNGEYSTDNQDQTHSQKHQKFLLNFALFFYIAHCSLVIDN